VVLDLQLPGQEGLSLAEEIRHQPFGLSLPLLLLSSPRPCGSDSRPQPAGISIFIHKPIRPVQLLDALHRALGARLPSEKKPPAAPALDTALAHRLPLRVLLADDNLINQKVGLSVLQKLGYRADAVNNGLEVIAALERKAYDVLFLDVQMPEMDGLEAARRICRRWGAHERPFIIAMTGNALLGDREKCLEAGMDDYISKPVRIPELQHTLERWGPLKLKTVSPTFASPPPRLPAADQESELLDRTILADLKEMSPAEGIGMLEELVDLFLEQAPQSLAHLTQKPTDPASVGFEAHSLKSMSLNLGATRMATLCRTLETMARAADLAGASALLTELQQAFDRTREQLLAFRNEATQSVSEESRF
jgi:CheY-like chemotaxis protein